MLLKLHLRQHIVSENVATAQAAMVALKQPWSPIYSNSNNIVAELQAQVVDRVSAGVTVTIKTTNNPQIAKDGTITYPGIQWSNMGVIGNVTFTLTKGAKTVDQTISVIIFPLG